VPSKGHNLKGYNPETRQRESTLAKQVRQAGIDRGYVGAND